MTDREASYEMPGGASSWYAATAATPFESRRLAGDIDVDVCVIGGGIAGLTAARALMRRKWSVAVLEADRIGHTAEALGPGVVAPGFPEHIDRVIERVGEEAAREIWRLSAAAVASVRAAIEDPHIAGAGLASGCLQVEDTDNEHGCRHAAERLQRDFGIAAEYWPTERVRAVLRSAAHHQAIHLPDAFHLHPLNYALGLAFDLRRAGARVYEQTPALSVDPEGIRKRVRTETGVVRARSIVLASPDAGRVMPLLDGTVMRLGYRLGVTAPLGERLERAVGFPGAVMRAHDGFSHRIVMGERLLWAEPLSTTYGASPVRKRLGGPLARLYPALRRSAVDSTWSAVADYAVHRMPQIGELAPGLWLAGAFGRHGIANATMAGELIAAAILDGDDRWQLFRPYGLVWAGGRTLRTITDIVLRARGARGWMREQLSRVQRLESKSPSAVPPQEEQPGSETIPAEVSPASAAITSLPPLTATSPEPSRVVPTVVPPATSRAKWPHTPPRQQSPAAAAKRLRATRKAASRRPHVVPPAPLTVDAALGRGKRRP